MATSVSVQRILSWHPILALPSDDLSCRCDDGVPYGLCLDRIEMRAASSATKGPSETSVGAGGGSYEEPDEDAKGATSLCWSPDGRTVAVGLADGGIVLRSVEPGCSHDDSAGGEGSSSSRLILPPPASSADGEGSGGREHLPPLAMVWGRLPSSLALARADGAEREMASAELLKGGLPMGWADVLPRRHIEGLDYTRGGVGGGNGGTGRGRGGGTTVLCAATDTELHWYLNGRYRILTLAHGLDGDALRGDSSPGPVFSPDLGALVAVAPGKDGREGKEHGSRESVWVYGTDLLSTRRTELASLSESYELLFLHLHHVTKGIEALDTGWRSALKPLETKLASLADLLKPYSASPSQFDTNEGKAGAVRSELFRFILAGRSSSGGTSSALDQFFTRGHMHDQLLQREATSIEGGLASVEVKFRNGVLHSCRAAACESERLYGQARADPDGLVDADAALELCQRARGLYLTATKCHAHTVEARRRLRDLLRWIRGTSSQVRAWGTAGDSVQRRNARDRRVSGGVADRVAGMLSGPYAVGRQRYGEKDEEGKKGGRTVAECVLGVPLSDYCAEGDAGDGNAGEGEASLAAIAGATLRTAAGLFDRPRTVFAGSVKVVEVRFESDHVAAAVHSRIGPGVSAKGGGAFVPSVDGGPAPEDCPHWILVARSLGRRVEVLVLPGGASNPSSPPYCYRAVLDLPDGCAAREVSFYGDGGLNSLCPADGVNDPVKERRQALCLVVDVEGEGPAATPATELWQFKYDDLAYRRVCLVPSDGEGGHRRLTVPPVGDGEDPTALSPGGAPDAVEPRRRRVGDGAAGAGRAEDVRVRMCGPRGTGGVLSRGRSTVLEVLDMEEDEEEEEDDDDEEEEEDGDESQMEE